MTDANAVVVVTQGRRLTVPFHGANLYLVEHNEEPFVPMRPVVEGMGLDWKNQHTKLTSGRFQSCVVVITTQLPGDSQRRAVVAIPLRKLTGWLMSVHPGKVKPELRDTITAYQNECDDALWAYWNDGAAVKAVAVPATHLSTEQYKALQAMNRSLIERLPKAQQGKAVVKLWSALRTEFGCASKDIPAEKFTDALSVVARAAVDWDLVDTPVAPGGVTLTEGESANLYVFLTHFGHMNEWLRKIYPALEALDSPLGNRYIDHAKDGHLCRLSLDRVERECKQVHATLLAKCGQRAGSTAGRRAA